MRGLERPVLYTGRRAYDLHVLLREPTFSKLGRPDLGEVWRSLYSASDVPSDFILVFPAYGIPYQTTRVLRTENQECRV